MTNTIQFIEVRGVTRLFGAIAALRGVRARFEAGEVTFLMGPNGAGKSTLLAIVGTVLSPSSGTVWYEPIGESPERVRSVLGWVAHESHCYPELTGRQNIELAARWQGVSDIGGAAETAIRRVQAERFSERSVGTLSRGQRQRVALARALVHDPSVLLLDEPWTGLDRESAERLFEVLCEERDRGALILVVSHSEHWSQRMGARILKMEGGRVAKAQTTELTNNQRH